MKCRIRLSQSRGVHDAAQVADVGFQSRDFELIQHTPHTFDGKLAVCGPYDELADHRVVVEGIS